MMGSSAISTVSIATASRQDARDVEALINGLRGLMSLASGVGDIPDAARRLLEDVEAESDGNRVTIQFSVPLRELRQIVEDAIRER